jgi:uncharacterized delta-60 repeat protein
MIMNKHLFFITLLGFVGNMFAQMPGDLDLSFDTDGMQTIFVGPSVDVGRSVVVQPDGKIIVAGYSDFSSVNVDFSVARFNPDGSVDNSFDFDGKQSTSFTPGRDYGYAMALQADGKVVVAGYFGSDYHENFGVVRYNSDGSLDNSFDLDGMVTYDFGGRRDFCYGMAIQSDGKLVLAGESTDSGNFEYDFAMIRLNINGTVDSSFGIAGQVLTDFSGSYDRCNAIVIQHWDGKIILGGNSNGSASDFALARYNTNGSLDHSFDFDGKLITDFAAVNEVIQSIAIQPDRKIVALGYTQPSGSSDFAIARYNTEGSLDTAFGNNGLVTTDFQFNNDDWGYGVVLQSDGKIVAAGIADLQFGVTRYNYDGSLDTSFSSDGMVTTDFEGLNDDAFAIALQPDGRIVVAGYSDVHTPVADFAVARYWPSANVDVEYIGINPSSINIYPNPTQEKLNIAIAPEDVSKLTEIRVLDLCGKIVESRTSDFTTINRFYFSNHAAGLYFLQVCTKSEQHSFKLIVE